MFKREKNAETTELSWFSLLLTGVDLAWVEFVNARVLIVVVSTSMDLRVVLSLCRTIKGSRIVWLDSDIRNAPEWRVRGFFSLQARGGSLLVVTRNSLSIKLLCSNSCVLRLRLNSFVRTLRSNYCVRTCVWKTRLNLAFELCVRTSVFETNFCVRTLAFEICVRTFNFCVRTCFEFIRFKFSI